jgi:hypothetical protein
LEWEDFEDSVQFLKENKGMKLESGPLDWGWGKNAWAFQYKEYPLFPGASLEFRVNSTVSSPATMTFEFYDSFSKSRPVN